MTDNNIRLVGVYNADGGIKGELAYVFGKLRGTVHCASCDISYFQPPHHLSSPSHTESHH